MKRRTFLQLTAALAGFTATSGSCKQRPPIKGQIIGASAAVGHLLRDKSFGEPALIEEHDVVVVGGGVSGLSAARSLVKEGITDFVVLDLEQKMGGNAVNGQNEVSAYPWGAHYIPTPNNDLKDYLDFLKECGVITGESAAGLPIYNDYHLCFDPEDRLYINGSWQEGLVPHLGVPEAEQEQIQAFLQQMEHYRWLKGSDGRDAFAIPVDASSRDADLLALDTLTMKQWLTDTGFTSSYLHWYVNYCTRDDFGTTHDLVSAWAGIHYFASRKGKGDNAEHQDVLTWPEGNGWLVQQLEKNLKGKMQTGAVVVRVTEQEKEVLVDYLDLESRQLRRIRTQQCILAVPQFVAARLLGDKDRVGKVQQVFHYMPWMVANLTVTNLEERSGAPRSWDNVLYDSDSLGYVEASHQLLQQQRSKRNLTYYLPLTGLAPAAARKEAQQKTYAEWVRVVMDDLKKVHPNIEKATEELNVMIWGHAMVQPLPRVIHGGVRAALSRSINNHIHFAHTDLSGISIFEEGFYQGLYAARKVIQQIS